jgi:hypothetical protein
MSNTSAFETPVHVIHHCTETPMHVKPWQMKQTSASEILVQVQGNFLHKTWVSSKKYAPSEGNPPHWVL